MCVGACVRFVVQQQHTYDSFHCSYYYWNHQTDEIVWEKPADYVAPRDAAAEAGAMRIQAAVRGWRIRMPKGAGMESLMAKPVRSFVRSFVRARACVRVCMCVRAT